MRTARRFWSRLVPVTLGLALIVSGVLLTSGGSPAVAASQVAFFQQGVSDYHGCVDTRISEEKPTTNFGTGELIVGMKGRASILTRFDVSSLPPHSRIVDATLRFYVYNFGQRRPEPIIAGAFILNRAWEEMEATWLQAANGVNWTVSGANGVPSDRSGVQLDQQPVHEIGWYEWDITAAVQQWVDDEASNQGVIIRQVNPEIGGEYDIRQSEYPGIEYRPNLTVEYTLATPTPTRTATEELPPCAGTPAPGSYLITLQQGVGYDGAQDSYLSFDDRDTSFSDAWFMHVGYRQHDSGLIKFDVSSVPPGSQIICAFLSLFAERWSGGPLQVGVYGVLRPNSVPLATWNLAAPSVPWQEGGCTGPDDRLQAVEDTVTVQNILRWWHWDVTRLVDGWVNDTMPNHGLSIQAMEPWDNDTVWFTASDDGTVSNRPKLHVLFVPPPGYSPTATPLPTATPTATPTAVPTAAPSVRIARTLQQGVDGCDGWSDARISAEAASANFARAELKVGARQGIASLIAVDLTDVPAGAMVESASLQLYVSHREGASSFAIAAYPVACSWDEAQVTWNAASATQAWAMPGCESEGEDRAAAASATQEISGPEWYSWDVRADMQRMIDNPEQNHGWLLKQEYPMTGVASLYCSEASSPAYRPKLVVTYLLP